MVNSRATNKLELLDHHLATGTEGTYTFTKTLDMKNTYREIIMLITGKATATFSLHLKINAQTDYDFTHIQQDTTTLAGALDAAAAFIILLPSNVLDGAVTFVAKVSIIFNDAGDLITAQCHAACPHEGLVLTSGEAQTGATTITSLETLTSTSTWIAGTEITTYGIKR